MGVPLITLAGDSFVSLRGASHLINLNLKNLIASTAEDYLRIATSLASDIQQLESLRRELRNQMRNSPITNGRIYATKLEAAFMQIARGEISSPESA